MTDNEIIKALHICAEHEPFEGQQYTYCGIPLQLLFKEILAFVNRKQAEIEKLQNALFKQEDTMQMIVKERDAEIERLKEYPKCVYEYDGDLTDFCLKSPCSNYKTVEQIKAEAIKEFADRLKDLDVETYYSYASIVYELSEDDIDNLVAEMVGDEGCSMN